MLVKIDDLHNLIRMISQDGKKKFTEVIAPVFINNDSSSCTFKKINPSDDLVLDSYRSIDPVKILLYNVREKVYPANEFSYRRIIFGVRACDLKAIQLMDKALINSNFVDQAYKLWRDSAYIISLDCTDTHPSCNCILVNGKPYAEDSFDLNLSVTGDYYLISVGSSKGEELLTLIKESCTLFNSDQDAVSNVQLNRKMITDKLTELNHKYLVHRSYESLRQYKHDIWDDSSSDCVGCGACTNICPTCYCLILNDESDGKDFIKVRSYDSCQTNGYARVAGGASPRPKLSQRFRNRYLCKFDYMKHNFDTIGCTGCGRCIEACPAIIDFREVIYSAQNYAMTK